MKANLLTVLLTASLTAIAQPRQEMTLTEGWSFSRDQQTWQTVRVPHDWAIAGPFDKQWDLQKVAIEQNGETEAPKRVEDRGLCLGLARDIISAPSSFPKATSTPCWYLMALWPNLP